MNTAIYHVKERYIELWNSRNTSVNYFCDSLTTARALCKMPGKIDFNKYLQIGDKVELINVDSVIQDTSNQW